MGSSSKISSHDNEHMEFYYLQLIDYLVKDIRQLELETIRLRYELSKWLPDYDGLLIRSDIYSGLAGRYDWQKAYASYVALYCNGIDPLDNESYSGQMRAMAHQGYLDE